jgi:hypothetical protein
VRELEAELGSPRRLHLAAIEGLAARRRGRPLQLLAVALEVGPCGVWIVTDRGDYVFYERATSPLHHRHIILHELSHVLCGHVGGAAGAVTSAVSTLLPHLREDVVRRVLTRTSYSQMEEQEAEILATLLLERVAAVPSLEAWQPDLQAPSLLNWRTPHAPDPPRDPE